MEHDNVRIDTVTVTQKQDTMDWTANILAVFTFERAAAEEVKETVLFLPQDIVQKSVGFSFDVGKILFYLLILFYCSCLDVTVTTVAALTGFLIQRILAV